MRPARESLVDFIAPPVQFLLSHSDLMAFINDIIYFPAKSIQCGDRTAYLGSQEQKAVIKTGAAGGCFFLAVLLRRNEGCTDNSQRRILAELAVFSSPSR